MPGKMNSNFNKTEANREPLALLRPYVDQKRAVTLASSFFGLRVSDSSQVKEFVSYDDRTVSI